MENKIHKNTMPANQYTNNYHRTIYNCFFFTNALLKLISIKSSPTNLFLLTQLINKEHDQSKINNLLLFQIYINNLNSIFFNYNES